MEDAMDFPPIPASLEARSTEIEALVVVATALEEQLLDLGYPDLDSAGLPAPEGDDFPF
jgi:hypothetical protein